MQIVISIPDDVYDECKGGDVFYPDTGGIVWEGVRNGTPLPKGHGRLIDADRLRSMYSINRANFNTVVGIQKWINDAPTIIEADKAESEEVC